MAPKSNIPIRIGGSKVRTGCQTCKQRRVKCDEARPVCLRCQTGKRQCIYVQPQLEQPQLRRFQRSGHVLNLSPSPFGPREIGEVNAVKSFTSDLGKELAGCFSDDIWCRVLPLVAQHEPTIWHGIVAVSTLRESVRLDGVHSAGSKYQTALKQYTKAIQGLNLRLGSGIESKPGDSRCAQKHVVLLSCILFLIFECTRNHWHAALRHVYGGMKLIEEWNPEVWDQDADAAQLPDSRERIFGYFDHSRLIPTFFSLDSQAVKFSSLISRDRQPPSTARMANTLLVPAAFKTVEDANSVLSYIVNRVTYWLYWHERPYATGPRPRPTVETIRAERHKLRMQLTQWDFAFMSLRLYNLQPATLLLLIQRKIIQVQLEKHSDDFDNRPLRPSEIGWDKYIPLFQEAVEHAEAYCKLMREDFRPYSAQNATGDIGVPPEQPKHVFTVTVDLLSSLTVTVVKCRDPGIRRRALWILKNYGSTEGFWDSRFIAGATEQMMNLEESGATETGFIPDSSRIHDVDISVGQEDAQGAIQVRSMIETQNMTITLSEDIRHP